MASTTEPLILYDIPSRDPLRAWSPNTWKTRLQLNFKGIDYKTEWVGYPQIESLLKGHVPPDNDPPPYTLPAIRLPDGKYVMDSYTIAGVIEEKYPNPPLPINQDIIARVRNTVAPGINHVRPCFTAQGPKVWLSGGCIEYWNRTRTERVGMPLDEFEAQRGGPKAWEEAAPHFTALTAVYKENGNEGPFLAGREVQFADFIWIAYLLFWRSNGVPSGFERLLEATGDPEWHLRLLKAAEPWTTRNDH